MARLRITEEESEVAVKGFRDTNKDNVALWERLDNLFKQSCGSDFEMELPSGRILRYKAVRRVVRPELDEETGKTRLKQVYQAYVGERRATLYGGKLTENLIQAIARDIFVQILLWLDEAGIHVPFSVHDEAVCEVDENYPKAHVETIMSRTPDWFEGCPVACEAVEATRYQK
jgi:DNA polymerase